MWYSSDTLPMPSVLNAPWVQPPPKRSSPTHRPRNFCRIWESPEPMSQEDVPCSPHGSGVTQMDVDPKEVSIATVLQNLSCGAPKSTPPLHLDPLPSNNVNDQRSISPILGTNMTNLPIVSTISRSPPMILPQIFPSTPQSSPSPPSALPLSPLSEDRVPFFYASPPNHSHSPAHPQLTDTPSLTESVLGTCASGDENNSTCMEDDNEDPFIHDTSLATKKVPLHFSPSSLLRRCSSTHNPVRTECINVLSPGPQQRAETEVFISSKHAATRCRRKRTRPNYFGYESSGEERAIARRTLSGKTYQSQVQTHIGYLSNADLPSTSSTHDEEDYDLDPQNPPDHSPSKTDHYTPVISKTIKSESTIIDLTEDVESDVNNLMVVDSKLPHNVDEIRPPPASSSTVQINKEDHPDSAGSVKPKPPTKRRISSIKSKAANPKSKSKTKSKFSDADEEELPTIEHVVEVGDTKYFCSVCNCTLNRSSDYRRHSWSNKHREACNAPKITYECPFCQEILCRSDALKRHVARSCRKRYSHTDPDTTFTTTPTPTTTTS